MSVKHGEKQNIHRHDSKKLKSEHGHLPAELIFSLYRPWRSNTTVSVALVERKKKNLDVDTSKKNFPSPHIPPGSTVCDYKHTI